MSKKTSSEYGCDTYSARDVIRVNACGKSSHHSTYLQVRRRDFCTASSMSVKFQKDQETSGRFIAETHIVRLPIVSNSYYRR
jgi:hypothetical protein